MNLSDNNSPAADDESDVLQRVRSHGAAIERALPELLGADIREDAVMISAEPVVKRRRTSFLVAAAAVVAVGGLAAYGLSRPSNTQQVGVAADSAETSVPPTAAPTTAAPTTTAPTTTAPTTTAGSVTESADPTANLMPTSVEAADFGPPNLRYLPPADSGFAVSSGAQILLSQADHVAPVAIPTQAQRVSMRATDPSDRRGILIEALTYADTAAADLIVAAHPTAHGTGGDPMDFAGIQGMWLEEEGFAPFSAGNPPRMIVTARVRISDATVLDVSASDVSRGEIEALITSLEFAADGTLQLPTAPAGFTDGEIINWTSSGSTSTSDYLVMVLVGLNGEQLQLNVIERDDQAPGAPSLETGETWVGTALFGETVVGLVGSETIFILTDHSGQTTEAELTSLVATLEKVDDATWIERLAIAPLTLVPVMMG